MPRRAAFELWAPPPREGPPSGLKEVDVIAFNGEAEAAFVALVRRLVYPGGRRWSEVIQEAAYELDIFYGDCQALLGEAHGKPGGVRRRARLRTAAPAK